MKIRFSATNGTIANLLALRDLFNHILPYLKAAMENQRLTAVTALERTNVTVLDVLFDAMKPVELDYRKGKTKRKDRNRLRNIVCCECSRHANFLEKNSIFSSDQTTFDKGR